LPVKADLCLSGGTYTPTLTSADVANLVDPPGLGPCNYVRVGGGATVSCLVTGLLPISSSTLTQFHIKVPVDSVFSNANQCVGSGMVNTGPGVMVMAQTDNTNFPSRCLVSFISNGTGEHTAVVQFTYRIQ
jgi:hypothetical protein